MAAATAIFACMTEEKLSREKRLRRVALVCCHFARNMAYYRAAREDGKRAAPASQFWFTVDNNFIDHSVLEWCKLFADDRAEQGWREVVDKAKLEAFEGCLLGTLGMDATAFGAMCKDEVRSYRDKFVAHLDSEEIMTPPHLDPMWGAVRFYFRHVMTHEMEPAEAAKFRAEMGGGEITDYFTRCFAEARKVYPRQ